MSISAQVFAVALALVFLSRSVSTSAIEKWAKGVMQS